MQWERRSPPAGHVHRQRARVDAIGSIALYAATLLASATLVFLLPRAMPGDPLAALADPDSGIFFTDPEARARVLAYYGLDRPLWEQYAGYLGDLGTGNLGWSIARNAPVAAVIAARLPWTLLLVGCALTLSAAVSFVTGVTAAWHHGGRLDRAIVTALTALRAVPEYALAAVLLIVFGVLMPLFPLYGSRTMFVEHATWVAAATDVLRHLALPLAALTLSLVGSKFLLVRNTVIGTLGEDYMLLARAKGLALRRQKYRHAGRNALLPFLTAVGIRAAFAVGGAIFVESVFAYPGMGTLILESVETRDYPVLEAAFLTLAATVLSVNLLIELVYGRLDPRVAP